MLRVQYKSASNTVLEEKEIETPFTAWFSADGTFHPDPLRKWLAKEIKVLGLAAQETEKTGGVASVVGVEESDSNGEKSAKRRR